MSKSDTVSIWIPENLNGVDILCFVAKGGMGVVLKGIQAYGAGFVAVKLMMPSSSETTEKRFIVECEIAKDFQHPNIVRMLGSGKEGNLCWLTMEWVDGRSVCDIIAEHKASGATIDIKEIAHLITQIIDGLSYLHTKNIVHRDLKPSNILVTKSQCAKITDFGIARNQDSSATMYTMTGASVGSTAYMSPEQVRGRELDDKSDIYSLGLIWQELLTATCNGVTITRKDCPIKWKKFIKKCLEHDPNDRPSLQSIRTLFLDSPTPPPEPVHSSTYSFHTHILCLIIGSIICWLIGWSPYPWKPPKLPPMQTPIPWPPQYKLDKTLHPNGSSNRPTPSKPILWSSPHFFDKKPLPNDSSN